MTRKQFILARTSVNYDGDYYHILDLQLTTVNFWRDELVAASSYQRHGSSSALVQFSSEELQGLRMYQFGTLVMLADFLSDYLLRSQKSVKEIVFDVDVIDYLLDGDDLHTSHSHCSFVESR